MLYLQPTFPAAVTSFGGLSSKHHSYRRKIFSCLGASTGVTASTGSSIGKEPEFECLEATVPE